MVDTDTVGQLVDALGGVWFDVPQDMDYNDPYQNLQIHRSLVPRDLQRGGQHPADMLPVVGAVLHAGLHKPFQRLILASLHGPYPRFRCSMAAPMMPASLPSAAFSMRGMVR